LSPHLTVRDADAALNFYQRAFGFEKRMAFAGADGRLKHVEVGWKEAVIMFAPQGEASGCPSRSPATSGVAAPVALYLYCDDVDALFARATAAGAKPVEPPRVMFWGDRVCTLLDLDGYPWSFATNVADFDPAKVPA
jgi:uncharacterized glyoxalase superfamily protein PhnB